MKTINNRKHIKVDSEGIYYPIDEEKKSIELNGTEYVLPDEVWNFMLCLESEKEYFRKKHLEPFIKQSMMV
jgi:hypothetical protein